MNCSIRSHDHHVNGNGGRGNRYPKVTNFCVRFIHANYVSQVQVA